MNIAVIKLKDIIKYLVRIIIVVFFIIILASFFRLENIKSQEEGFAETINNKTKQMKESSYTGCLDLSLSLLSYSKREEEREKISVVSAILNLEIGMLDKKFLIDADLAINEYENQEEDTADLESEASEVLQDIVIERVYENNIVEKSTNSYNTVYIYNESDYEISEEMLIPDVEITNKKDVFIYHAHTCESYTPSEQYNYEMTGNFRTIDLNYNVVKIGSELANYLNAKGFNAIHDMTYHDYPTYSGSYARALETAEKNLFEKDTQLVLDLHRDAVGSSSEYAPRVKINDMYAAQLMFVIGTNGGGLEHPNWIQNLKIAVLIQEKANEMYPGLFRPILIRNSRYNQHIAKGAAIIEVGATGNTMEQCILSMQCLANVLEEVCK